MRENVDAALRVARRLGITSDEPVVMRDLSSAVVHLAPAPVVARAWPTGGRDPAVVDHELRVTAYLARCGAAVTAPYDDAGPHVTDGHTVTLWTYVDHDPGRPLDAMAAGRSLREIHELLGSPDAPQLSGLPHFVRLDRMAGVVTELEVGPEDRTGLEEMLSRARIAVDRLDLPSQPLHGDAWLGNVLRTPAGPVWTDFELLCRGPIEVDLAANESAAESRGRKPEDDDFLEGYGDVDLDLVAELLPLALVPITAWTYRLAGSRPEFLAGARARLERALAGLPDDGYWVTR